MFGYDSGAWNRVINQRGNTTRTLLLVLLLIIAGAGYAYYFTDLIKPQTPPAPPVAAPVKNPIPPRADQGGPGAGGAPVVGVAPSAAPAAPSAAAPQAAPAAKGGEPSKPAPPPPAAAPAKAPPAKTATAPAAPDKPAPAAKPAPAPVAPAKAPAAPAKTEGTPAKKEAAPTKAPAKGDKAAPPKKGAYALLVGDFVPDSVADIVAKLKKNGVSPVKKQIVSSVKPMNRLFIDEFAEQERAESELQQLKRISSDAFLVASDRTYTLYAGSYYTDARVMAAKQRLEARGIKPVIRKANLSVKVARITAGNFATSEEAGKASQALKKAGVNAKVVKAGP